MKLTFDQALNALNKIEKADNINAVNEALNEVQSRIELSKNDPSLDGIELEELLYLVSFFISEEVYHSENWKK